MRQTILVATLSALITAPVAGQAPTGVPRSAPPVFTEAFPPEEFAARRARLMTQIGDGVAILQGAAEKPAEAAFRQNNQFFYLSGVETPRAILVIDGLTKRSTLYLAPGRERAYGPMLGPNADAPRITGMEAVMHRDSFAIAARQFAGRVIYTTLRAEVTGSGSPGEATGFARATKNDPWDGRSSREEAFVEKLKAAAPGAEIKELDPLIDGLRAIKSPREIEVIHEATRIAGLGIMEAMREAKPGMREYELQAPAEFVFKKHGAQGAAYFALVATGTNTLYSHYHKGTAVLQDGDLVQFDYAPDYNYYVSDVTRVFPANGKFTPWQREYYTIYLRLYQSLLTSIKPNVAPREIIKVAAAKMDSVLTAYRFTDEKIKAAATTFVNRYKNSNSNSLGHTVGLEVHDVRLGSDVLKPGHLFTIEPAMIIPDLHYGIRLEDVILITEAGYENLSAFVPVEIADIERLMAQKGAGEALLPGPARKR
ncbi:MAG: Xaa-Pro peptidase family protein [Gemmatimonadota bacterium]